MLKRVESGRILSELKDGIFDEQAFKPLYAGIREQTAHTCRPDAVDQ